MLIELTTTHQAEVCRLRDRAHVVRLEIHEMLGAFDALLGRVLRTA